MNDTWRLNLCTKDSHIHDIIFFLNIIFFCIIVKNYTKKAFNIVSEYNYRVTDL